MKKVFGLSVLCITFLTAMPAVAQSPGLQLDNNIERRGSFTTSDTANTASRFYWFGKLPSVKNYVIKWWARPGVLSGLNAPFANNVRITLSFLTADGTQNSSKGTINITNTITNARGNYSYIITQDDFGTDEYIWIEVRTLSPGTPGNFAISWNSEVPTP